MDEIVNYLNSVRREYAGQELTKDSVAENPFKQLFSWINDAVNAQVLDPAAMILSTVGSDNKPSARTVLIRGQEENGIIFYTNYDSKKGQDLVSNPYVAITFFWVELDRQILIRGRAEKTSYEASQKYFSHRPKESQISAIASNQSGIVENRKSLEDAYAAIAEKYNIFKKVSTRFEMPDGTKAFEKAIVKNPEKYFTAEIMEQLEKAVFEEFNYGSRKEEKNEVNEE